jgi:TonB C terminal
MRFSRSVFFVVLVLIGSSCALALPVTTSVGSHAPISVERWRFERALADAYAPQVRAKDTVALADAKVPFAYYINTMHSHIHPVFQGNLKQAQEEGHDLRGAHMSTEVEIVLSQQDGDVLHLGVVTTSGSIEFDAMVLDAIQLVAPFGSPPPATASRDGKVYVHWTFYSDPSQGCASRNARPL